MALTDVGAIEFPQTFFSFTYTNLIMDAAGEMAAFVFHVPKSGTINKIGFRTRSVVVSDALAVGLYDVDTATGFPVIASPYKGMVAGTVAVPAAFTWHTVTLSTPASNVVQGDTVAVIFSFPAYVAGNITIVTGPVVGNRYGLPYTVQYTAAWAKTAAAPICTVEYSDGSYAVAPGVLPDANNILWAYNADTAGADEYGLRFTAPCNMRVSGWWGYILPGAASEIVLYSGTTQLAAATLDNDITQASGTANQLLGQFPASVDLVAGQQYRLTLRPSDGVANSNLYYLVTPSAAAMAAMPMGTDAYGTSRLNLGAWTDLPTYRPQIGVVASHVDDDVIVISPDRITHNPTIWDPTSNLFWNPFKKLWTLR